MDCVVMCFQDLYVYPHGGPPHSGVDGQGALARGADALHDDAEDASPALPRLTDQAVIQVHFPERPEKNKTLNGSSLCGN